MNKVFLIAEAGVNHNGCIDLAKQLIDIARDAGADAVKFQTFQASKLTTNTAPMAAYQQTNLKSQISQNEMLQKLELSFDQFKELNHYCHKVGITFLSTPFDESSASFLVNDLNMPIIKIPSGELTNHPFLAFLAKLNKELILSTGMATLEEVLESVTIIENTGFQNQLTLLHCTSSYPCPVQDVNLRAMKTLQESTQKSVGLSDHTLSIESSIAATALGATVIEKHFTLDRTLSGPDHAASLTPQELKEWITAVRNTEMLLGSSEKKPTELEIMTREIARQKLVVNRPVEKGTILTDELLSSKRSPIGILPKYKKDILGKTLARNMCQDESITWEDLQ